MFENPLTHSTKYNQRREIVFLLFAGIFLGSISMLNILGLTKIIQFTLPVIELDLALTVGVLAYPVTFLCTDFISEFYGRKRANLIVWVGLILNLWVLFILWLGDTLPPNISYYSDSGRLLIPEEIHSSPNINGTPSPGYIFKEIKTMTFASTLGSMVAYLLAQFVDVRLFHFFKKLTKGKHLWLRNNGSTLVSQLVDSIAVILVAHYYANAFLLKGTLNEAAVLISYIYSGYLFKMISALLDTIPFYIGSAFLKKYLGIDPIEEFKTN